MATNKDTASEAGLIRIRDLEPAQGRRPVKRPDAAPAVPADPCMCCGRGVARRKVGGRPYAKLRVRHRCPHGEWCKAGESKQPTGFNEPDCLDCKDAMRAREGLPSVRRTESALRAQADRRARR